jgi:glycosyltransferase involved in cell wall biosynthesis
VRRIVLPVERAAVAVVRDPTQGGSPSSRALPARGGRGEFPPLLEIVVPVHNEERDLERSIRRLRAYLDTRFPFHAMVTIADNASTDATEEIGRGLAAAVPGVHYLRLTDKGRGRALAAAWLLSDAEVVAYMDVDLSTDLDALLPLVAPLISGHSEVAIGSRLSPGSRVRRGARRELISRCYNVLLRLTMGTRFRDAQCGFKALRAETARRLLPRIENRAWFFDTELLVLAQRDGLRIHEVPVDWDDDPDSRVAIVPTALEDLRGILRLMRARLEVVPADGSQVVEDPHPERDDRRDRKVHTQLVP